MAGHWFNTVEDVVTGKPVVGAVIEVYQPGATVIGQAVTSGTYAAIFSDDGITSVDQSIVADRITSDSTGFFEFWTDLNSVVVQISYGGSAKRTITDVEIIGANVSGDLTALSARVDKHDTVFGLAASALDLGTFTGTTISDNADVVTALQELETAVEAAAPGSAYTPGGTDVALADGGTGASLVDPNADRIFFWDDSAGSTAFLEASTGLTISGTTLTVDQAALTSVKPTESIIIACSDETTALTTGTAKVTFRMPYAFTLSAVRASVTTAPTGANIAVDINEGGVSILSTVLTIDVSEKTSTTAATAAVISDSALADDAEITIDIDTVGSTIAGAGLKVYLIGTRT
jgi:hypothetical protein